MNLGLKKTVISLVMLFASTLAMPLFAQQPTLDKKTNGYYIIENDADFETFRQIVATGNPYANAVLTNDINVYHSIGEGEDRFHYRGTFDGQGHLVTLKGETAAHAGMFAFTKPGCVIRNLHLRGMIQTNPFFSGYCGALVDDATGTVFENCFSEVSLYGESSNPRLGGFVGVSHGECFFENCAFGGYLYQVATVAGFVAHNEHGLSLKNCYSLPQGGFTYNESEKANFFTDNMGEGDVCLNCYYESQKGFVNKIQNCIDIKSEHISTSSGQLCYLLNKGSKKGIVWYHGGDQYGEMKPQPFKDKYSELIISHDDGVTFESVSTCSHSYSNHICSYCGDLEPDSKVEPLQKRSEGLVIDNIKYLLDNINGDRYCIVTGIESDAKAVHIPERIIIDSQGKIFDYPVKSIGSLHNSSIEYVYIPNSVETISTDFNGCTNLKYIHIADGGNSIYVNKVSADCPLETVYIGRNLRNNFGTHFADNHNIKYLYWGPRTSVVGFDADGSYKFCGDNAECNVIFLGDEQSGKLTIKSCSDLSKIKHYYVNRNITGNCHTAENTGLYDACETVEFGPFVTTIEEKSFWSENGKKLLKFVDFNHAYNLETIGDRAFAGCGEWNEALDFSTMKVKNIGEGAFAMSGIKSVIFDEQMQTIPANLFAGCRNLSNLRIPSSITSIGALAFSMCENLKSIYFEDSELPLSLNESQFSVSSFNRVYLGRNITTGDFYSSASFHADNESLVTIGPKVTNLSSALFRTGDFNAFTFEYSPEPLHIDGPFEGGATNLFLDRDIVIDLLTIDSLVMLPFSGRNKTQSILLGENISKIPDQLFAGFSSLTHVVIPSNIKEIGRSAFNGCEKLQVASILGEPNIKDSAFIECNHLSYLYFMGNSVQLAKNVFKDCPIKEVTTNFNVDPENDSAEDAFDGKTYSSAQLINAKDIEFTSNPWVKFNSIRPSGTNISENAASGENFDKASIHHKFPEGEFDMVYLPFDMDSYYFGVDAEIYRLDITDEDYGYYIQDFNTPSDRKYAFSTNDINFVKVDIDNEKRLSKGNVYFIKVKHEEESMAAYFSFFESNGIKVVSKKSLWPKDNLTVSQFKADEWAPTHDFTNDMDYNYYVFSEGVLKRINGEYHPERATALLLGGKKGMDKAFNLNGGDETITSSVTDVTFSEKLKGYSSFYAADYNYIAPEWMDVYIVKGDDESTINLEQVEDRTITKGEAVLLKSGNDVNVEGGIAEHLTYATHGSSASYEGNLLKGVKEDTPADQLSSEGFVYALNCNQAGENTGFYKLSGDETMPTGKAYLDPSDFDPQQVANDCLFVCDGSSTDVKYAPAIDSEQDGREQGIYDLMGRRLKEAGFTGVYVVNGKKVIIK